MFLIEATVDDWDHTTWVVGYVERADEVEQVLARLRDEQRENRRILGPLRREERIFWKRYHDAQRDVCKHLAIDAYNFDLIHKITKASQHAWSRRHVAYWAKREELALTSTDRHQLPSRLEYVTYSARELRDVGLATCSEI